VSEGRAAAVRLAVDLGGTTTRVALVRGREVLERREAPTPAREGPGAAVEVVTALAVPFLPRADGPICVAATGHVRDGRVSAVNRETLPGWDAFPLADALAARSGRPVWLVNDAQAAAWGEARFGAGRGARDFVFVTVSTGIGAGVVADGRLLRGSRGLAGHVGFWRGIHPAGGGDDILERSASGTAIARAGAAAFGRGVTTRDVFARTAAGDPTAQAIVADAVDRLARALVDLRWLVDPEYVAIGGSVGLASGYLPRLAATLRGLEPRDPLPVIAAELGADAGLLGAADLLGDAADVGPAAPADRSPPSA
jgi:predicted NBD/HSP70 family sugar kinase